MNRESLFDFSGESDCQKAYKLNTEDEFDLNVRFAFLDEKEWHAFIEENIKRFHYPRLTKWKLRRLAYGMSQQGRIYIRKKARTKRFFAALILHELGHAVLCLSDRKRPGIMCSWRYFRF